MSFRSRQGDGWIAMELSSEKQQRVARLGDEIAKELCIRTGSITIHVHEGEAKSVERLDKSLKLSNIARIANNHR